jgi:biopolymer transport protein ExbB/TolQ
MERFFVSSIRQKEFQMNTKSGDTNYLLLMRFVIVNAIAGVAFFLVWRTGWVKNILTTDGTYICRIILVFFAGAVVVCSWKLFKMTRDLNIAREYIRLLKKEGNIAACEKIEQGNSRLALYLTEIKGLSAEDRYSLEADLRENMAHKISGVGNNMTRLVTLGIIGTVIGMKLFITGFEITGHAADPNVRELLNAVLPGLNVAVSATLVGGIASFWLEWLFEILESGNGQLISALIKAGVYRAKT